MELRLDPASPVPLYAQMVEQLRAQVASGALRAGDQLPSVRELAAASRVNRNTAAKVYQMLESDGVIETRAGSGCYVAHHGPRWPREERLRRLEKALDQALVEAVHLEIPLDEVPPLLERRIQHFGRRAQRPAGA